MLDRFTCEEYEAMKRPSEKCEIVLIDWEHDEDFNGGLPPLPPDLRLSAQKICLKRMIWYHLRVTHDLAGRRKPFGVTSESRTETNMIATERYPRDSATRPERKFWSFVFADSHFQATSFTPFLSHGSDTLHRGSVVAGICLREG